MTYSYPAIFHMNKDFTYTVIFPDIPGCITEGKNIYNAFDMSKSALRQMIEYMIDKKDVIPKPSDVKSLKKNEYDKVEIVSITIRK